MSLCLSELLYASRLPHGMGLVLEASARRSTRMSCARVCVVCVLLCLRSQISVVDRLVGKDGQGGQSSNTCRGIVSLQPVIRGVFIAGPVPIFLHVFRWLSCISLGTAAAAAAPWGNLVFCFFISF